MNTTEYQADIGILPLAVAIAAGLWISWVLCIVLTAVSIKVRVNRQTSERAEAD